MDDVKVRQQCLDHNVFASFCKFRVYPATPVEFEVPGVIKLPNYHGGKAKWKISSTTQLEDLKQQEHTITWGDFSRTGYLTQESFLSQYIVTEPFLSGRDLRVYTYLDRQIDEYSFKYLEREVKDDKWMANIDTKSIVFMMVPMISSSGFVLKQSSFSVDLTWWD